MNNLINCSTVALVMDPAGFEFNSHMTHAVWTVEKTEQ